MDPSYLVEGNQSNAPLLTNKEYTSIIAEPLEPQKADAAASKMGGVKPTRSLPSMPLMNLDAQIQIRRLVAMIATTVLSFSHVCHVRFSTLRTNGGFGK